jgi:alkanesulfonate monooxygenase SsuD/methylene tetrahydromethanopterin reductase-like flavin-dependent oxidoreductase (luciferase family)
MIEEVCMLDNLSNGRLDLGFGRGISPYELGYFGIDSSESRSIMEESLEVLIQGLTQERLNHQGKYFQFRDVPMELNPLQRPYPPLWYPTRSPDSVKQAARQGYNCVTIGPPDRVHQNVSTYWDTWTAHRDDPGRLNFHVPEPKMGVARQVIIADTEKEAHEMAKAAHGDWFRSITRLWHAHDDHGPDGHFGWEPSIQDRSIIFGTSDQVKEQVEQLTEETGSNYLLCAFAWGTLSYQQSLYSMRIFADTVMPFFCVNSVVQDQAR